MGTSGYWFVKILFFFVFWGVSGPLRAETDNGVAIGLKSRWESKYVSEGRDNLGRGGVYAVEAAADLQGLSAGVLLLVGDREEYRELNLSAGYSFEFDSVDAYLGYGRLEFLESDESDNEICLGISLGKIPYVVPSLDYAYSDAADGGFMELSVRSGIEILAGQVILEPYVLEGFDFGYASDEYDGPNNLQVGIDFTSNLLDPIKLVGSIAHSWALRDVKNDGMGDVSWLSIGLTATF